MATHDSVTRGKGDVIDASLLRDDEREMLERCEKATPGPWYQGDELNLNVYSDGPDEGELIADVCGLIMSGGSPETNTPFIAHSRTDLPELLRRLVEARSKLKRTREIVAHCLTPWDSFTRGEYKELTELLDLPVREPR
jgi:hypothetical protein